MEDKWDMALSHPSLFILPDGELWNTGIQSALNWVANSCFGLEVLLGVSLVVSGPCTLHISCEK